MLDRDWSLSGKNGRSGLVAMVYVVATRGKLLKGTSREQTFLQKRPVAIKHFCERDQSRSQITTSNYKLEIKHNERYSFIICGARCVGGEWSDLVCPAPCLLTTLTNTCHLLLSSDKLPSLCPLIHTSYKSSILHLQISKLCVYVLMFCSYGVSRTC